MDLAVVKTKLVEISTCFYQERISDGMNMFMDVVGLVTQIPEFAELINPLFDAVEHKDYVLAADIFYHEMAMRIQ
ncbi:MAG: hypothetical protein J1F02_11955 [Lachnospiraceae bacterium]|nr:hypothetical protein [Lachnospiraceae bacterium]